MSNLKHRTNSSNQSWTNDPHQNEFRTWEPYYLLKVNLLWQNKIIANMRILYTLNMDAVPVS